MSTRAVPPVGPADDMFHEASDDWWETETAWFSFNVPEAEMGGWLYNQVLANQGICNGGAWVWDASDAGALYEMRHQGLPMPEGMDLRAIRLPNGNSITMLEPLRRYRLQYTGAGSFEADLTFDAIMAPHSHPLGIAPFWKGRHFDQAGRVSGTIVLHGEPIEVDCLSVRDRSWGPRPMGPTPDKKRESSKPPKRPRPSSGVGYVFGSASPDDAFLAYTIPMVDSDDLSAGFLIRDSVYGQLVAGRRTVEFEPEHRWITRIALDATDETGRRLHAEGKMVSHHGDTGPSGTGLFHWEWDGASGWGEDQSFASEEIWQSLGAPARAA